MNEESARLTGRRRRKARRWRSRTRAARSMTFARDLDRSATLVSLILFMQISHVLAACVHRFILGLLYTHIYYD